MDFLGHIGEEKLILGYHLLSRRPGRGLKREMEPKLKIDRINKVVFTTPHATVVMKNGAIEVMKVCRPAYKEPGAKGKEHEERDIIFESWSEFCQLLDELKIVVFEADQELNK